MRDCEAFVAGRYQSRLGRRVRWEWAWINTLAHAPAEEIAELAMGRGGRRTMAAAFSATEVLAAQQRWGWDLEWLQREFLVPVELDCMRGLFRTPCATTGQVLRALRRAQEAGRPSHRPPSNHAGGSGLGRT